MFNNSFLGFYSYMFPYIRFALYIYHYLYSLIMPAIDEISLQSCGCYYLYLWNAFYYAHDLF